MGFGLCEEAGLVVEPDRRMRVIGGQGVIVVEVDPKGLSYEDDVFAVRGVRVRLVPPQDWIGADRAAAGNGAAAAGALTVERLVSGLQREVGAGGSRPALGCGPDQHHAERRGRAQGAAGHREQPRRRLTAGQAAQGDAAMQPDEQEAPVVRLNARDTDAFDLGNLTYFPGPNVYLPRAALVFDLALTGGPQPLPVADYVEAVAKVYPHLTGTTFPDHAHLFAGLVSLVSRLDIGLHLDRFSVHPRGRFDRVATQALDRRTQHRAVYFVWDWLEAIGAGTPFDHAAGMAKLQALFNRSPFGGPTTYALLRTADARGIPTVYRRDEGLMQYGYGRRQVRGVSTTFSTDSQLDSDFTTRKDDCKAFLGRLGFPVPKGDVVSDLDDALAAAEEIGFPVAVKPLGRSQGDRRHRQCPRRRGAARGVRTRRRRRRGRDHRRDQPGRQRLPPALRQRPVRGRARAAPALGRGRRGRDARPADRARERHARPRRQPRLADEQDHQGRGDDRLHRAAGLHAPEHPRRRCGRLAAQGRQPLGRRGQHRRDAHRPCRQRHPGAGGGAPVRPDLHGHRRDGGRPRQVLEGRCGFGIIEINAAPGVYMHVKPAKGEGIDVPGAILDTWFGQGRPSRIPIFAFNALGPESIKEIVDLVLSRFPHWNVGAVCTKGVFVNRSERPMHKDYNTNVENLLRNPTLDLLLVAYDGDTLELDGMVHQGHDMVVLDKPTPTEEILARDLRPGGTLIKLTGRDVHGAPPGAGGGVHARPDGPVRAGVPARGGADHRRDGVGCAGLESYCKNGMLAGELAGRVS